MKKCLITGCEGFIGSHLADFLVDKGLPVYAMTYGDTQKIDHLKGKIDFIPCDLRSKENVNDIIYYIKPDIVFHLAAQSFVTVSWENPEITLQTNIMGTFNLLESIRMAGIVPFIEVIGSSAVYGFSDFTEMPLKESRGFCPTSMYGVSKVSEEVMGYFYWKAYGMKIIRVRPFNMTGPRKTDDACSDFSRAIVEVEKGIRKVVEVGNLDTVRDFTDGRDAVKAMWLLTEKGKLGEIYNLCSGKEHKMEEILHKLISLSHHKIGYRFVPEKTRTFDDPVYIGDNTKLSNLGWKIEIPLEKTLADMLDYWRQRLS
jgi:GDP-4-dehydro-6-deoxy-D-mannose reductase